MATYSLNERLNASFDKENMEHSRRWSAVVRCTRNNHRIVLCVLFLPLSSPHSSDTGILVSYRLLPSLILVRVSGRPGDPNAPNSGELGPLPSTSMYPPVTP